MGSHFGVGAPPISEHTVSGDWDGHWGLTGVLTHSHVTSPPVDSDYAFPLGRRTVAPFVIQVYFLSMSCVCVCARACVKGSWNSLGVCSLLDRKAHNSGTVRQI